MNVVVVGDLLNRHAVTDRLHGDPSLELGAVGAALSYQWEPPFQGRYPASEVNDGVFPEKLVHLTRARAPSSMPASRISRLFCRSTDDVNRPRLSPKSLNLF